ncbi:MAG TPA: GNAT family N-acetyltransferase [Pilimelia sp.]|nr:GNAT family N-acetyltransferase [Pilimelia sp.]
MTIHIRPAEPADLASVGDLHARSRLRAYTGIVPAAALAAGGSAAMAEWWEQRWTYERTTHRLAVAADDADAVLGFTYVGPSETPGATELYAIHVDPDRQGGGIGRALMADVIAALPTLGRRRAVLWVLIENAAARRFYERGGWVADGAERSAPLGPALTRQARYTRLVPAPDETNVAGGSR